MKRVVGGVGGVMEVEFRQALEEQRRKSTLDSSALQADLAKRYKLPGSSSSNTGLVRRKQQQREEKQQLARKEEKKVSSSSASSASSSSSSTCPSCCTTTVHAHNSLDSTAVCRVCGYYVAGVRQPVLTLAQRRGLVQAAPKVETVSAAAWAMIEGRVDDRKDAFCPICMDGFKQGHEVLLSCSHMFHRHCLHAFEQFMGRETRSCPICRTSNYQKKITQRGSKAFGIICAVKLQAFWRGAKARKTFRVGLRSYYQRGQGEGSKQRRRFYERELSSYADRMAKEIDTRSGVIDSVCASMDNTLEESRQLDALFLQVLQQRQERLEAAAEIDAELYPRGPRPTFETPDDDGSDAPLLGEAKDDYLREMSEEGWHDALDHAKRRGHADCSICMTNTRSGRHGLVLLSCSHVLHQHCIGMLEKFLAEGVRGACCICRQVYSKRSITQQFDLLSD